MKLFTKKSMLLVAGIIFSVAIFGDNNLIIQNETTCEVDGWTPNPTPHRSSCNSFEAFLIRAPAMCLKLFFPVISNSLHSISNDPMVEYFNSSF